MSSRFIEADGEQIRRLRRRAGYSLRELGDFTGVSYDTIFRLENGKQQAQGRTLRTLAEALGAKPHELMRTHKGEE